MKIVILGGGAISADAPHHDATSRGIAALGTDDGHWVLINVSAAVAQQLARGAATRAHRQLFDADVRAVVLTDAQVEHMGGLLGLRNGSAIDLYATPAVFEDLTTTLPVLPVLQHYCGVHWHVVPVAGDTRLATFRVDGMPTLEFTALATQMPSPPHAAHQQPLVGDSIALAVRDLATGQRVFCAPGLTRIGPFEFDWMREADCLLVDGQMSDNQPDDLTGSGASSWVELLSGLPARHKVLFAGGSAHPRRALAERGIALAYDGLEIDL